MLKGLMMDEQLTTTQLLHHAAESHAERELVCFADGHVVRYTNADLRQRVARLVSLLRERGIGSGDVVSSLAWNSHRHLELYFAVPALGAILNTVNPRLSAAQVRFIIEHAESKLVFHDESLSDLAIAATAELVLPRVVMGQHGGQPEGAFAYEDLLAQHEPCLFPEVDERAGAILCYTSGTTGNPKGVLFSHRAIVLHAMNACLVDTFAIAAKDVVLPLVPMFHANCWGLPFAAAITGAGLVLTGQEMGSKRLVDIINSERVSFAAGVPTIWLGLRDELAGSSREVPTLTRVIVAGSAMAPSLMEDLEARGIQPYQGFGMTETGPMAAIAKLKPAHDSLDEAQALAAKLSQGRLIPSTRGRIVDEAGNRLPHDGKTPGELQYRGPLVASGYFNNPEATLAAITEDGWFCSGDICTIDPLGYIRIVDRAKDLVKSGGEWISSIDLENAIMGHPQVAEAAVISVDHPKWVERPLAVVVLHKDAVLDEDSLKQWLSDRCAKWWIPDKIVFCEALPRNATGKISKRDLRSDYAGIYA